MSESVQVAAINATVTIITVVSGVLMLWLKMRANRAELSKKIDDNTILTKQGTDNATINAKKAVANAADAKVAAEGIAEQLNGALDKRISVVVQEHTGKLEQMIVEHNKMDEKNFGEIKQALADLKNK